MSETATTTAPEKKTAKKKAAPKSESGSKPVKKAAPKAPAKAKATKTKPESKGGDRLTVRVRALKALAKGKNLTATEVQTAIGLGHGLKPTLDQEVERGHLAHAANEKEGRAVTYKITAKGLKALENGTVNPVRGEA